MIPALEPWPVDLYLTDRVASLLDQFEEADSSQLARCAETVACELVCAAATHEGLEPEAVLRLLCARPSAAACGVLAAAAMVTTGANRRELTAAAADMRARVPAEPWFNHIGTAVATGTAARDDTFADHVAWMIELDDGLHRYSLLTAVDLRRNVLTWVGPNSALDDPAVVLAEDRAVTQVPVEVALEGIGAALSLPAMWGVTTTDEMFGLWARWRLWQLERPHLIGPPPVDWTE